MDSLKTSVLKFFEQLRNLWVGLTLPKKVGIGVVGVASISGILYLALSHRQETYSYIFTELSQEDITAIVSELNRIGLKDYIIDAKGVKVPTGQEASLRIKLAEEGLPAHGQVGWEKFDTQDFTRTEFEQQIHRLRAIQGELSRTIMSIEGISSARVHIVMPRKSLFVEDQKETTAAVYIKSKRGTTLSERQIRAIVHLVSRSVEGLRPNNVTLIDGEGQMLTKIESEEFAARMTKEMQTYKQSIEKELEGKIRGLVGKVVGPEKIEAKVDVTVDFTQEERTISEVDPEKSTPLSKNTTGAKMQGSGLNPTGIPGSKSNVPGEQEQLTAATNSTENRQESEVINFEVSKTLSKKTLPIGTITRISTAVLVDGKQDAPLDGSKPVFEARTEEEMKQIEALVKKAIGFKDGRDEVQVSNMMFQIDSLQMQQINEAKKENREYISTMAISAAMGLALMLFFMFIVRPYFRWLSYDPERKSKETIIEEFKPDLEMSGSNNIQVKEDIPFEKLSPKEQILFLARHEPKRTTEALRMLLNPHQSTPH